MRLKVISDNGYVMQMIRPMKGQVVSPGVEVEVKVVGNVDLVKVYDNLIDEEMKERIVSELRKGMKKSGVGSGVGK